MPIEGNKEPRNFMHHRVWFQFADKICFCPKMMRPKSISNQTKVGKKETLLFPHTVPKYPPEHAQTSHTVTDFLLTVLAAELTFWNKGSLCIFSIS